MINICRARPSFFFCVCRDVPRPTRTRALVNRESGLECLTGCARNGHCSGTDDTCAACPAQPRFLPFAFLREEEEEEEEEQKWGGISGRATLREGPTVQILCGRGLRLNWIPQSIFHLVPRGYTTWYRCGFESCVCTRELILWTVITRGKEETLRSS